MLMHVHYFDRKLLKYEGEVNVKKSIPPHPRPLLSEPEALPSRRPPREREVMSNARIEGIAGGASSARTERTYQDHGS
jgi:hypothetical protein